MQIGAGPILGGYRGCKEVVGRREGKESVCFMGMEGWDGLKWKAIDVKKEMSEKDGDAFGGEEAEKWFGD